MLKNIVFDFGQVLIEWNPRALYRQLFANGQEMEYFLSTVCPSEWNMQMDGGKPFEQGCAERIQLFPQYAEQIKAYYTRWGEMMGGAIEGSVQILRELKQRKYPVYALSNWSTETFPLAQKRFDFLELFDGIVISGVEKCVKPDPEIYQILLDRYHLQAQACIFTDDKPANIEGAKALGFDTILFTSPEALRAELKQRGIL